MPAATFGIFFPTSPGQSGYNNRVRKLAATMCWLIRMLACDMSLWGDDVWLVDSTPVECGRSKETVRHSDLAGCAAAGIGLACSMLPAALANPIPSGPGKLRLC